MEIASSLNIGHRIITLTEILPLIRQLQMLDKLRLIRILAEQVDTDANILPLESDKTYNLPTPYNTFGAAEILMNTLRAENTETL